MKSKLTDEEIAYCEANDSEYISEHVENTSKINLIGEFILFAILWAGINVRDLIVKLWRKLIPCFALVLMFCCTEEIIVPGPERVVIKDSIVYRDRIMLRIDSVAIAGDSIPYPVPGADSIHYIQGPVQWRVDTVYVVLVERDTVVERVYGDTLVMYTGGSYQMIPEELQPITTEFFVDARKRGFDPPGGMVVIAIEDLGAVQQAYSHHVDDFHVIVVNGRQTYDAMFIPIYREMARWQLDRDYSADTTHPMCVLYPSNKVRWSNRGQYVNVIDKIFNP